MTKISIGIEIEVTFKAIKNQHLSVHPPTGRITISSPEFKRLEKIKIYAATKLSWIKREQEKLRKQPWESSRLFINRESHYLFGNRHLLEVHQFAKNKVEIKGKKIILHVTDPQDYDLKKTTIYRFFRTQLRKKLKEFIAQYSKEMKLEVPEYGIRWMKTKWGSCAHDLGKLWFNVELAKKTNRLY